MPMSPAKRYCMAGKPTSATNNHANKIVAAIVDRGWQDTDVTRQKVMHGGQADVGYR
jgi:hypothetical protein